MAELKSAHGMRKLLERPGDYPSIRFSHKLGLYMELFLFVSSVFKYSVVVWEKLIKTHATTPLFYVNVIISSCLTGCLRLVQIKCHKKTNSDEILLTSKHLCTFTASPPHQIPCSTTSSCRLGQTYHHSLISSHSCRKRSCPNEAFECCCWTYSAPIIVCLLVK